MATIFYIEWAWFWVQDLKVDSVLLETIPLHKMPISGRARVLCDHVVQAKAWQTRKSPQTSGYLL